MPSTATQIFNRSFRDALEFMDEAIENASIQTKKFWFSLIARGAYPLGQGLVQKRCRFFGSMGDLSGLTNWREVEAGSDGGVGVPGRNNCRYEADLVDTGMDTVESKMFEAFKRTKDICINDIKWTWQFEQQLRLMTGALADVTIQTWENHNQERYLSYAGQESRIFVMAPGAPDGTPLSTNYDPFTTTDMVIPKDIDVGTLDWTFMEHWYQYFGLQCPSGRVSGSSDAPIFGIGLHPADFTDMLRRDADLREDWRHYRSETLIEQYMSVPQYKGWALMNYLTPPRFRIKTVGASTLTLERVLPYVETTAATHGTRWMVNADYIRAEYALAIPFVKNVLELQVPPAGPASVGGMRFGAAPSLNGEFYLINIPDRDTNPLGEVAFYLARFQCAAIPGENAEFAMAYLYKRCPQTAIKVCEPCAASGEGTWVTILSAEAVVGEGESATAYTQVKITLAKCLPCESPAEIQLDYNGTGGAEAVDLTLVDGSNAPEYIIGFQTADAWIDASKIVAGTTTMRCE